MPESCTIDEFREYQQQLWDAYKIAEEELLAFSKEHIPLSGFLLVAMLRKLSAIQLAIFDLCESENYYSLNIIYRSFIEHYLKFLYSFLRLLEEKNDDVGKDYYVHGMLYECQALERSQINAQKLAGETEIERKFSGQQDKFKLRDIIKYINDKIPACNSKVPPLILIPMYSRLSSFVHCGHGADVDDLLSSATTPKEFTEIPDISFLMFSSSFLKTFVAFDNLHRHFKGKVNNIFAEQSQKSSNIYYEIQSKLNSTS